MSEIRKVTALILAASRLGPQDVVAQSQNLSHKCLVTLDGMVMLERVVREIQAASHVERIFISIESADIIDSVPVLKDMRESGEIKFVQSRSNLFLSVTAAAEDIESPYPLIITTADNALHTTEMVDHFCSELFAVNPDAAIAMTPAQVILDAYPEGKRAFHNLKDGGWSSCNLYALTTDKALVAARIFEGGGQFGKNPHRIRKAFGLVFMLLYRLKLASMSGLFKHLSKRWGMNLQMIQMPYADAPIDVDNLGDVVLTEKILKTRRAATD